MKAIELNGKEYPFRITMGAMLRFKRECGKDVSELEQTDIEGLLKFMWCCVKSACSADEVEFGLTFEQFADRIDPGTLNAACRELTASGQKKTTEAEL